MKVKTKDLENDEENLGPFDAHSSQESSPIQVGEKNKKPAQRARKVK